MEKFIANKALADELKKRFKFIEKAHQQILVGNYNIAKNLLNKVIYEDFQVEIMDDYEKETKGLEEGR